MPPTGRSSADQVDRGGSDHPRWAGLEFRALQWLYGSWLPRSGFVPDDQAASETCMATVAAEVARPFAKSLSLRNERILIPIHLLLSKKTGKKTGLDALGDTFVLVLY